MNPNQLQDEDLKHRKLFHKPIGQGGRVLPHASYVKEFIDEDERFKTEPVRLASNPNKGE